jgi:[NiFe] hydrogenase diaphorase moiety small subunit
MSDTFTFTVDGKEIAGRPGDTIMAACDRAGIWIPRLCAHPDLAPHGSCRICTVLVNGRPQAACIQPATAGMIVDNAGEAVTRFRKNVVEMLFVEGNHYCPVCEKSGNCELQALGYRFGMLAPKYPYQFPNRPIDMTHPDVMLDGNRCVKCGRCVRASRDVDGKHVFDFVGRGHGRRIGVDAAGRLGATKLAAADKAADVCPVGSIVKKRVGYAVPVGRRKYDHKPIGSEVETPAQEG